MEYWQLLAIAGVMFIIIEIFTPVLFFFNFAIASFITALVSLFIFDWNVLIPIFVVLSLLSLFVLRPLLIRTRPNNAKTGVEEKYIGKIAKVVETVTSTGGVVSIYDERWTARSEKRNEISIGEEVKIVRNESLILYVEKVEKSNS